MNTFSWVICKCQSGNGAEREREREREKPGKYCSNLSIRGLFAFLEPGNGKAQARGKTGVGGETWGAGRKSSKKQPGEGEGMGAEPRNTEKRLGYGGGEGEGCGWSVKRVNQEKQFK